MTDPRNPQQYPDEPWPIGEQNPQPHDGWASAPPPPTAPTSPGGPTSPYGEQVYVVESGQANSYAYRDAPDPFGQQPSDRGGSPKQKKRKKGWIIPIAVLVALAMISAAVYFLFLQPKDDDRSNKNAGSSSSRSEGTGSGEVSPDSAGTPAPIAGTYDVNGTIESYSGTSGQLGGATKKAGDQAFKAPQTWTIDGPCAEDKPCNLVLTPGGAKITLKLTGQTWIGEATEQVACSATQNVEAKVAIEIPKAGGTAKRTVSAPCAQPINEVDNLTLTKK